MRMTASARSAECSAMAETSSRWHVCENARCASSRQNAMRKLRGMPAVARSADDRRGLPAASITIAWNSSFQAI